jgi:hypothetical protein
MAGGPTHVDTFDYKPKLFQHAGTGNLLRPPYDFRPSGKSGLLISELRTTGGTLEERFLELIAEPDAVADVTGRGAGGTETDSRASGGNGRPGAGARAGDA